MTPNLLFGRFDWDHIALVLSASVFFAYVGGGLRIARSIQARQQVQCEYIGPQPDNPNFIKVLPPTQHAIKHAYLGKDSRYYVVTIADGRTFCLEQESVNLRRSSESSLMLDVWPDSSFIIWVPSSKALKLD